jgi:hypothetical protein
MSVYVDDMYKSEMGRFSRMKMSHMQADTDEELHVMADKIGIARKWFQGDHYDIAIVKRDLAISRGAIPITMKTLGYMRIVKRETGRFPNPVEARSEFLRIRGLANTVKMEEIGEQN